MESVACYAEAQAVFGCRIYLRDEKGFGEVSECRRIQLDAFNVKCIFAGSDFEIK